MGIDLTAVPVGASVQGDSEERLTELRAQLRELQLRMVAHGKQLIVLVEGWEAAGKRDFLRDLGCSLDPCRMRTFVTAAKPDSDEKRHWLARFWAELPAAGNSSLFYRSWYRTVIAQKIAGAIDETGLSRGCDEINEFEAQQCDHDTIMVKLFFHMSEDEQARRLEQRWSDPWMRTITHKREDNWAEGRAKLIDGWHAVFEQTDTRWAPWTLVDAEDEKGGRAMALETLVRTLDKALPATPPAAQGDHVVVQFPATGGR
ncbi:polyphosphate kinase 2 family protein [Sphingomicrobium sediminis]|uniref:Polyphosphate kinase n=1 Tax=Sphingomicrobium sediminis TaxID=2950949 RepID=A0A9X2EKC4_9SPHN|nr:polyphosphate kinase [Sphingomicrobium sediminis]MCM8556952.1 polyphosphate kinase [Sphingomicrobium sediminis]